MDEPAREGKFALIPQRLLSWSDWDAERHGFEYEAGVGLTLTVDGKSQWFSWDETIALAAWLKEKTDG